MNTFCQIVLILSLTSVYLSETCANPPTQANYSVDKYEGKWYEVAKYQTAGGAYFERNCTCT